MRSFFFLEVCAALIGLFHGDDQDLLVKRNVTIRNTSTDNGSPKMQKTGGVDRFARNGTTLELLLLVIDPSQNFLNDQSMPTQGN